MTRAAVARTARAEMAMAEVERPGEEYWKISTAYEEEEKDLENKEILSGNSQREASSTGSDLEDLRATTKLAEAKAVEENLAGGEKKGPRIRLLPLDVYIDEELSSDGFCRSCTALVSGIIENHSFDLQYLLLAYLVDGTGSRSEVHRMQLDKSLSRKSKSSLLSEAYFKVKVSGLLLGGISYEFDIVGQSKLGQVITSYIGQCTTLKEDVEGRLSTAVLAPSAPTNFECLGQSKTSVKLSWEKPQCTGGGQIKQYEIEQFLPNKTPTTILTGGKRVTKVRGLSPGTLYYFRVCALTESNVRGNWSKVLSCITLDSPPPAPEKPFQLESDRSSYSLHIHWRMPRVLAGSPISSFALDIVRCCAECTRDASKPCVASHPFFPVYVGTETSVVLSHNLLPSTSYLVRVRAGNACGWSVHSPVGIVATLGKAPNPPPPPTVLRSVAPAKALEEDSTCPDVEVFWAPPQELNVGTEFTYALEIRKRMRSKWNESDFSVHYNGSKNQCVLSNLKPGATYFVRVLARNEFGWSDPSFETILNMEPLRPAKPPSTPHICSTQDAQSNHITVEWSALPQASRNGADVIGYAVFLRLAPAVFQNKFYSLLNAAQNLKNDSTLGNMNNIPVLTQDSYRAALRVLRDFSSSTVGRVRQFIPGMQYDFFNPKLRVWQVVSVVSQSKDGIIVRQVTSIDTPENKNQQDENKGVRIVHPLSLLPRLRPGENCKAMNYYVGSFQNAVITEKLWNGYEVNFMRQCFPPQKTILNHITRISGESIFCSDLLNICCDERDDTLPNLNCDLDQETRSTTSISSAASSALTDGVITGEWSEVFRSSSPNVLRCTLDNLVPGLDYDLSYAAINFKGVGAISPPLQNVRLPSTNLAPLSFDVQVMQVQESEVTVQLRTICESSILDVDGWYVSCAESDLLPITATGWEKVAVPKQSYSRLVTIYTKDVVVDPTSNHLNFTFDVQKLATTFALRLRAFRKNFNGPWSQPVAFTTQSTVPLAPKCTRVEPVEGRSVAVSWDRPKFDGGSDIVEYRVTVVPSLPSGSDCSGFKYLVQVGSYDVANSLSFTLPEGNPGQNYSVCVAARNENGWGPDSESLLCSAPASAPPAPKGLSVVSTGQTWARCKWAMPDFDGGKVISSFHLEAVEYSEKDGSYQLPGFKPIKQPVVQISNTLKTQIKNLEPGSRYLVRVRCANSVGSGDFSSWFEFKTEPLSLMSPSGLRQTSTLPLRLEWNYVKGPQNAKVHYKVELTVLDEVSTLKAHASSSAVTVHECLEPRFSLNEPRSNTTYQITVRAICPSLNLISSASQDYVVRTGAIESCQAEIESTTNSDQPDLLDRLRTWWSSSQSTTLEDEMNNHLGVKRSKKRNEMNLRKTGLSKVSRALKLRNMPWYVRHPRLGLACISSFVALVAYLSYVFAVQSHTTVM